MIYIDLYICTVERSVRFLGVHLKDKTVNHRKVTKLHFIYILE